MDVWTVQPGSRFDLSAIDAGSTPEVPGNRDATMEAEKALRKELGHLQGRLRSESNRSLLVVLQAMDAGGKDGTIRKVFSGVDPQGVHVTSYRAPSHEELAHDFLWRVHARAPATGEIGIFNRSHYEDVVAVRVRKLVPKTVWEPRFDSIVDFERHFHRTGTTIVKLFLHVSREEQARRLAKRVNDPKKRWKHDPSDLEDRELWDEFMTAYQDAFERTSTPEAPWRVIPADHKWYRNWAVLTILVRVLEKMDPRYPDPEPLE